VHQSHIQSAFYVHPSECIINTTKYYLTHCNFEAPPLMYLPLVQNSGVVWWPDYPVFLQVVHVTIVGAVSPSPEGGWTSAAIITTVRTFRSPDLSESRKLGLRVKVLLWRGILISKYGYLQNVLSKLLIKLFVIYNLCFWSIWSDDRKMQYWKLSLSAGT